MKSVRRQLNALGSRLVKQAVRAGSTALKPAPPAISRAAAPKAGAATGDWLPGMALAGSGARAYRLYRPPGLTAGERLPLLLMLHGCGQTAAGFAASTQMNKLARRERFWVLYPEQDRLANAQGCWQWFEADSGRTAAELAVLMAAVDQVCRLYPVDAGRVAVAGLSAGASMAALLGLRYPDRFRAVVMHSGLAPGLASSKATVLAAMRGRRLAVPLPPGLALPPLLVIQGAADPVVAAANGPAAARLWAAARGAAASAARVIQRGQRYPMTVTDFKRGRQIEVSQVEIARLGHAWSGGAAGQPFSDPQGPDASRLVWAFALRQFRRAGAAPHRPSLPPGLASLT